jgi:DNA-binding XRE family transcriptional regulator
MITNQRQYLITKAEIAKFEEAAAAARQSDSSPGVDPLIHKAMGDALASQLDDLKNDVLEYETLRAGGVRQRVFRSLRELPQALIEARIVARLSQRELAERLDLHEQQIQKYEATGYAGASLERIQDIADELGIEIEESVTYTVADA